MKSIVISDITMKYAREGSAFSLSFREKIEFAKMLDRLGADYVETGEITCTRTDGLLIRSLSSAVEHAMLTVPVPVFEDGGAQFVMNNLAEAHAPRLQVAVPVSTVQMEYLAHQKPDAVLELIGKRVAECRALCENVEFTALDSGRADRAFLVRALARAVESGATTVTISDTAGEYTPEEIFRFVSEVRETLNGSVSLGVLVSDRLHMAEACAVHAIKAGADEIKVCSNGNGTVSLEHLAEILSVRGESLQAQTKIRTTELHRTAAQINRLFKSEKRKSTPFEDGVREEAEFELNEHDDIAAVRKACGKLGYELTEDDVIKVYEAFSGIAAKKGSVNAKELDALIATSALQVPPTYKLVSYLVNSGNVISSSSHIILSKDGVQKDGLSVGDGPIDASFLAIEQITGTHYELDDFQIRAVTEGREAMGETIVRLRSDGKLYAGRGISTDIVGSSIQAYLSALNKIVYEEKEA
ncbi:MAG: hypothetical protein J5794_00675 [Lachnospiraceae bacterium]|nr:hypothetical protein [Lachnospiraceae bacterium]